MIEVFITNVRRKKEAEKVLAGLRADRPDYLATIDLEDPGKVLRVENKSGKEIDAVAVMKVVRELGFDVRVMP